MTELVSSLVLDLFSPKKAYVQQIVCVTRAVISLTDSRGQKKIMNDVTFLGPVQKLIRYILKKIIPYMYVTIF